MSSSRCTRPDSLIAALSKEALEEVVEEHYEVEKAGYEGESELLDHDAARHREPALSDRVAGGLHLKTERHVRPESFTAGLVDYLNASGVGILENTKVHTLARNGRHGWRIHTSRDELEADGVIVAASVWSAGLLAKLGVRLPLEGARGCSVTAGGSGTPPHHALKFAEANVTCSPFENDVRITGTLDLTGADSTLDRRRLETVIRTAKPYLHDWEPDKPDFEWAGLRPMTPDSPAPDRSGSGPGPPLRSHGTRTTRRNISTRYRSKDHAPRSRRQPGSKTRTLQDRPLLIADHPP